MGHKSIWNIRQGGYFIGDNFLFIYIYTDQDVFSQKSSVVILMD